MRNSVGYHRTERGYFYVYHCYLLLISLLFVALVLFGGCHMLFNQGAMPSEEYTKADRQFYSVLTSGKVDFIEMINGRQDLTATQKDAVITALDAWEYMIRKAEAAQVKVGE